MEVSRGRRFSNRDTATTSPERTKHRPVVVKPTFKRVQVVYYLSRNGHLEHPHFMEVTHLSHQHLRLKDVIDRLMTLRGKAMPSLYSWSCKRSYKNGYVWNDLAENDVIPPSSDQPGAPAEYVLKGSELLIDHTEKFQQLQVTNRNRALQVSDPTTEFTPKRKSVAAKRQFELQEDEYGDEGEQGEAGSVTPHHYTRCSRGVSTEEEETESTRKIGPSTELTLENSSPPSTASSTLSEKGNENNVSTRYEDGDPVPAESSLSRNSVLFQLISCGGSSSFRKASVPVAEGVVKPAGLVSAGRGCGGGGGGGSGLHKGVLCKAAAVAAEEVDEDDEMIRCMSENPRFGNFQAEEKEYFSGSIVESIVEERAVEASFKRSNSYNEERSSKAINEAAGGGEEEEEEEKEMKREKATINVMRGKCIPMNLKKASSKLPKK